MSVRCMGNVLSIDVNKEALVIFIREKRIEERGGEERIDWQACNNFQFNFITKSDVPNNIISSAKLDGFENCIIG